MPAFAQTSGVAVELLERAEDLSALVEAWESVERSGHGRVVLVSGEAGIGKTSLVRQFCGREARSARIFWGACESLFTPRPLGGLLGIAQSQDGDLESALERGAMPYEVATLLAAELAASGPTVLVLEDMHWADEATLDVLRMLARRVEGLQTLVVASFRDDELDREHRLRIVLGELATSRLVSRLRLARLSREAVAQLAEPCGVDATELYEKTTGNPFFVVEALAAGADRIPDTIRDAVLARIARLSPSARALLDAIAIVPQRTEHWLMEALAGSAAENLDECLSSGMLSADADGVAFRHELVRWPSRSPCRRTGLSACTAWRQRRWRIRPAERSISPGSPTTLRPVWTWTRCFGSRRQLHPGQPPSALTAPLRRSMRARFDSPRRWRRMSARSSTSGGRSSAG
jgi:hypothetical protein